MSKDEERIEDWMTLTEYDCGLIVDALKEVTDQLWSARHAMPLVDDGFRAWFEKQEQAIDDVRGKVRMIQHHLSDQRMKEKWGKEKAERV